MLERPRHAERHRASLQRRDHPVAHSPNRELRAFAHTTENRPGHLSGLAVARPPCRNGGPKPAGRDFRRSQSRHDDSVHLDVPSNGTSRAPSRSQSHLANHSQMRMIRIHRPIVIILNKTSNPISVEGGHPMRPSLFLALLGLHPALSEAQTASTGRGERVPDTVVVTATRTERTLDDVPATVTIKTAEELERELARDIRDLVRYEPGVSVGGTGERFGIASRLQCGRDGPGGILKCAPSSRVARFAVAPGASHEHVTLDLGWAARRSSRLCNRKRSNRGHGRRLRRARDGARRIASVGRGRVERRRSAAPGVPGRSGLGTADAASLQEAVAELESRGVREIGVVRLFVSGDSFLDRTEQILGLRAGARRSPSWQRTGTITQRTAWPFGGSTRAPRSR